MMNGWILTGSIATGKSTVASLLRLYGYTIISADEVAHKLLKDNSLEIEKMFGTSERKKLREIIFNNKQKREQLEQFLHPKIKKFIMNESEKLEQYNVPYFLDIPLFFEKNNYPDFDKVVVVYTPKNIQIQRLAKRDNISESEAIKVIKLQIDIEDKKKRATYVLDNSKDLKHLQKEVEKFIKEIKLN